jgi:uncharacterized protein YbaA (DUF1428 family)
MPAYIDGYVIPVPDKELALYRKIAAKCAKIYLEHGALEVRECVAEDLGSPFGTATFPDTLKTKRGETVVFSWITFKSRKDRDRVNAAFMNDPRLAKICDPAKAPFDCKRMVYGGFKTLVHAAG